MHDLQKLLAVKDGISRKGFLHVHPIMMSDDHVILHEGTQRAKVAFDMALEMIRAAPEVEALWLSLAEAGALWPIWRGGRM